MSFSIILYSKNSETTYLMPPRILKLTADLICLVSVPKRHTHLGTKNMLSNSVYMKMVTHLNLLCSLMVNSYRSRKFLSTPMFETRDGPRAARATKGLSLSLFNLKCFFFKYTLSTFSYTLMLHENTIMITASLCFNNLTSSTKCFSKEIFYSTT
jgi:hypothetical protein